MDEIFPYTPRKTKFDVLDATFVAREALLDELKTSIAEQAEADTLQHWMILGSRGMGKSHLIVMLYHIVKMDKHLSSKWIPLLMNEEEQGVFSLATLFTRIMTKLADELDKSDKQAAQHVYAYIDGLRGNSPEKVLSDALSFLKDHTDQSGKRLLVLLENADDLFTKCLPKQNEVKQLRKILQHDTDMLVIATSPTFFEGIRNRKGVFYDFFRIRRLVLLTYEQAISLLNKWKCIAGDTAVKEFKPGDYRLQVLYHLTGGNPRILLFLYLAISGEKTFESAIAAFKALLEKDLSNYYLSRLRDIPNQEQPIVTALAEARHNLTQKEIAEKTFLPLRSIGTFMGRLESAGLVRPVPDKKGKNTFYTLTDQMFRLWYQWRTSLRDKEVIESLVEFLSIWYKRCDLETLTTCQGITADYAREALQFRETEGFKVFLEPFQRDAAKAILSYMNERRYDAAHDMAETLIEFYPKDAKTWTIIGLNCQLQGNYAGAEEALGKALQIDSKNAKNWYFLGIARGNQGNHTGAEEALSKAVELDPKDAENWYYIGMAREDQGNHAGAEEALNKAVELDPKDAKNWCCLGVAHSGQGNHAGAEEALSKAVELDPKDAENWYYLGMARGNQGNHTGAEEALSKAVELDPKDAENWYYLGIARGSQGNYAGAEEALSKAVELDPKDAKNWCHLGMARGDQGNHAGAEEALSKAVELDPKDAKNWCHLGMARGDQGNHAGAEEALSKAVELDPKDVENWYYLGGARLGQGNHTGAEEALSKAVELDPKDAEKWYYLGRVRLGQGNHAGAEEALGKAVELDPKDTANWFYLGISRLSQGNHAGVEESLSKAVELDPKNADAWQIISFMSFQNYNFQDCITYSLQGIQNTDEKYRFFKILSEVDIRAQNVPQVLELLEKQLQGGETEALQQAYLYFYRASIMLHRKDFTPFRTDLQAGAVMWKSLSEEERKTVQGDLVDYLVGITYGDFQDEIIVYLENMRELAPDLASVFAPLDYVIEYLEAKAQENRFEKKEKIKAAKRTQSVLDRVPTELKAPVEKMVATIKNNNAWWLKRPKDKALLKRRS